MRSTDARRSGGDLRRGRKRARSTLLEKCVQGASVMDTGVNPSSLLKHWLTSGFTPVISVCGDDGFITLVDRKKDMIVSGGFNVFRAKSKTSSVSIRRCPRLPLSRHQTKWGEAVTAVVVLKPDTQCDPEELRALVRDRKVRSTRQRPSSLLTLFLSLPLESPTRK